MSKIWVSLFYFIGVEYTSHNKITNMYLGGRVLSGGSVELLDYKNNITLKCARIIYRFVEIEYPNGLGYFLKSGTLDYPSGEFIENGYHHLSNAENHMLISNLDIGLEVMITDKSNSSSSILLTDEQVREVADVILQSLRKR